MPFKLKLIKEFQKCIKISRDSSEREEREEDLVSNIQPSKSKYIGKYIRNKHKKKIIYKNYNVYQVGLKREPLEGRHVANFYNIIGINEEALWSNDCQQSYFRTLFYLKNVKKIQSRPNYLLLHLTDSPIHFPPISYIIERFKSFGNDKFFHVAQLMFEVAVRLQNIQQLKIHKQREQSNEFIEKYVQSYGNRPFVCRISNNKMVLSKSLLELLEYDPQQFAIQTLKFHTPIHQAASTQKYYDVIVKYFENLRNLLDLLSDKISLQTFLDNSILRFRDHFYTKRNKKIYCKLKAGMPSPLVTIFELEEIVSKTQEFEPTSFFKARNRKEIQRIREEIRKNETKTVRNLLTLPKNFMVQHQHEVSGYKSIKEEQN